MIDPLRSARSRRRAAPGALAESSRSSRGARWIELALIGVALATAFGAYQARSQPAPVPAAGEQTPRRPGPAGEVAFDHQVHAGKYKIPCLDCHASADKSPSAGVPSIRKCMGCHKFVAKEKVAVQLLAKRFEDGQTLRWQRVFAVPDFIYFSHRAHVGAKVECKECHGDVAATPTVRQEQPFTMGRCLACHEARQATRDCLACHK